MTIYLSINSKRKIKARDLLLAVYWRSMWKRPVFLLPNHPKRKMFTHQWDDD
jgi:hypothetical protein